jgi:hypothetical protein
VDLTRLLNHPALKGVAHRACAAHDEWDAGMTATHQEIAHAHLTGRHQGWVCIRKQRDFNATTLRHEIAHLVRGTRRHDEAWRRVVRELGGQIERQYRKR